MATNDITFHQDAKSVPCARCKKPIAYHDLLHSAWFGCPSCRTFFEQQPLAEPRLLRTFEKDFHPRISLGARCELGQVQYVVTGYLHKKERDANQYIAWNEYLLYSEQEDGYVTLVEFSGHWMLVRPLQRKLEVTKQAVNIYTTKYEGTQYTLYHSYSYDILFAAGAFDENVLEYEEMHTWEYIEPPYMVVNEVLHGKQDWYKANYMERSDVAAAFGLSAGKLPRRHGVGVIQPSPYARNKKWLNLFCTVMVAAVVLTEVLLAAFRPATTVLNNSYELVPDTAVTGSYRMIATEPFSLQRKGGLDISVSASLSNEWLEAGVTLVNDHDGSTYDFTRTLEYYSGVEGGESWSEGSCKASAFLGGIPPGRYHLNIFPYSDKWLSVPLHVTVERQPLLWSNALLLLLAILSVPFINTALDKYFEKRRIGSE